mmetsp:Transcript_30882/g.100144  ORF Transcript_30882/g.100144 Transcript_30882/m.100144 type:complete len:206 (-) Transcript_30882:341-958(-)
MRHMTLMTHMRPSTCCLYLTKPCHMTAAHTVECGRVERLCRVYTPIGCAQLATRTWPVLWRAGTPLHVDLLRPLSACPVLECSLEPIRLSISRGPHRGALEGTGDRAKPSALHSPRAAAANRSRRAPALPEALWKRHGCTRRSRWERRRRSRRRSARRRGGRWRGAGRRCTSARRRWSASCRSRAGGGGGRSCGGPCRRRARRGA